jgi:hypothetical protein
MVSDHNHAIPAPLSADAGKCVAWVLRGGRGVSRLRVRSGRRGADTRALDYARARAACRYALAAVHTKTRRIEDEDEGRGRLGRERWAVALIPLSPFPCSSLSFGWEGGVRSSGRVAQIPGRAWNGS